MAAQAADTVGHDVLNAVGRHVFGAGTTVLASRLLGTGSGNLAYVVRLSGRDRRFVFRFNRGFREDVYDAEAVNYGRVAAATGVKVPEVVAIDRSCSVAPTSYMVLEYLTGEEWTALCRPENVATNPEQKREIRAVAGRFYAALHAERRPAAGEESVSTLLLGLAQFVEAVEAGYLTVDLDKVAECQQVVRADTAVHSAELSLCMSDGEIYFEHRGGHYELAFVCDLEWVGFGSRLADLTTQPLAGITPADSPLTIAPDELSRDPFFLAYQESLPVDYAALRRLALYTQLSTWGLVAAEGAPAEKKRWIRENKLPLINRLIDLVAQG